MKNYRNILSGFFTGLLLGSTGAQANTFPPTAIIQASPPQVQVRNRPQKPSRFTTTVQVAVQEGSPKLVHRSQQLVIDQFSNIFDSWEEFHEQPFKIHRSGTELVFYINAERDLRRPMQKAMAYMINNLNGRVKARGRSQFYSTNLDDDEGGGFLEVVMDDTHSQIRSITAQAVPLRDILKEIKSNVGNISYLVPGHCASLPVDWSFGDGSDVLPKTVDSAMEEIGALFQLTLEKHNNTYIFRGNCAGMKYQKKEFQRPVELIRSQFSNSMPSPTEVLFPVFPLENR